MRAAVVIFGLVCAAPLASAHWNLNEVRQAVRDKAAADATTDMSSLLHRNKVIPDVVDDFAPSVNLKVTFAQSTITPGQQVQISQGVSAPTVEFERAQQGKLYTVLMSDPGVLAGASSGTLRKLASGPSAWQWLHWIVTNVPASGDVSHGTLVEEYSGPNPPQGNHRYVVLVFEQQSALNGVETPKERGAWDTRKFAEQNRLSPVGATFFYTEPAGGR